MATKTTKTLRVPSSQEVDVFVANTPTKTWRFPNSKGGDDHEVTQSPRGGYLRCTCLGYRWRKICKHVTEVERTLPGGRQHAFLLAAISFQQLGYHVIPVQPNGKCPLVRWLDYQTVRPTVTQICHWWQQWPNANVGLVISTDRLVIDLDGGDEAEALLTAKGVTLPANAPRVRTRSGYHVYLSAPGTLRNDRIGLLKAEQPLPEESLTPKGKARHAQVDVRRRGIIIAPPSVHASGHVYEWITPLTAELPEAPPELMALFVSPPKPPKPVCTRPGCEKNVSYRIVRDADGHRGRQYLPFCRQHEAAGELV